MSEGMHPVKECRTTAAAARFWPRPPEGRSRKESEMEPDMELVHKMRELDLTVQDLLEEDILSLDGGERQERAEALYRWHIARSK